MLQRIQTLFLLVVVVLGIVLFFVPIASFLAELYYFKLFVYEFRNLTPDTEIEFGLTAVLPLLVLNIGVIGLSAYSISSFKNRILQIRLVRFTMLLCMLMIVGIFVLYPNLISASTEANSEFEAGAYLPIVNLLFLFLANRYILKDEKLIRSMDRLR
ncbi:MAG: DUF4293 domain-containing protein [Bacteroidales bacterium]|nr:DUF4293 domain-containing protein [Bacteroidales bacterium]MCF8402323.1 DUF4293 domain-containing protein [Bacteroidales bacterium]